MKSTQTPQTLTREDSLIRVAGHLLEKTGSIPPAMQRKLSGIGTAPAASSTAGMNLAETYQRLLLEDPVAASHFWAEHHIQICRGVFTNNQNERAAAKEQRMNEHLQKLNAALSQS